MAEKKEIRKENIKKINEILSAGLIGNLSSDLSAIENKIKGLKTTLKNKIVEFEKLEAEEKQALEAKKAQVVEVEKAKEVVEEKVQEKEQELARVAKLIAG